MIELVGGPHDGACFNRRPRSHAIFVDERPDAEPKVATQQSAAGVEYLEVGVCPNCGVRRGKKPKHRQFAPAAQFGTAPCNLCGGAPV